MICGETKEKLSRTVLLRKASEDVLKHALNDIENLEVVLVDGHLKVQPRELAEVAVRPRVFSPKRGQRSRPGSAAVRRAK